MTLTLPNVPKEIDDALKMRAQVEGKSLDEIVIAVIRIGLSAPSSKKRRDLSPFAGSWVSDPEVDASLKDQDTIDPELWR